MKRLILIMLICLSNRAVGQINNKKIETVKIETSAICAMCEDLIVHKNLAFEKGVKYAEMDVETGVLTVNYRKDKTSVAHLRSLISKLGYCADSVKADSLAYENLHFCCKKTYDGGK
jgi:mercuric ion binding protein